MLVLQGQGFGWYSPSFLWWMCMLCLLCLLLDVLGNERFYVNINDKKPVQPWARGSPNRTTL